MQVDGPISNLEEQRFERLIGRILRWGVFASAAFVAAGGAFYLRQRSGAPPYAGSFHGEPVALRSFGGIVRDAAALHGEGLIQLGLLFLVATPIARVTFSLFGFLRERDGLYVGITLLVLLLLVASLTAIR